MTSLRQCVWRQGTLAAIALACAFAPVTIRADLAQEHVFVTVVDSKGRPVMGLTTSDFVVEIDGVAQEVIRAERATVPPSIVLLTDRLGLNSSYTPFDLSQTLRDFVKAIRAGNPDSKFGLTTFDGPVVQVTKFTSAPAELDRALGRLSTVTPTAALLDALSDASRQLTAAPTDRRVVLVVLASYRVDQSGLRSDLAGEQLRMSKGSLWAVEVRSETGNFSNQAREETLDTGSRLSGGLRDIVSSRSGIGYSCKRFAELILAQYDVTYAPAQGTGRSRLAIGVKGSGLRVIAPSWLSR
jgi:VWFA-related protein